MFGDFLLQEGDGVHVEELRDESFVVLKEGQVLVLPAFDVLDEGVEIVVQVPLQQLVVPKKHGL